MLPSPPLVNEEKGPENSIAPRDDCTKITRQNQQQLNQDVVPNRLHHPQRLRPDVYTFLPVVPSAAKPLGTVDRSGPKHKTV